MKHFISPGRQRFLLGLVLIGACLTALTHAQTTTQSITLGPGWNSVWLEVEPVQDSGTAVGQPKAPQDVFNHPSVQIVTTPKPLAGLSEFFANDPGTIGTFNQDQWEQWKRVDPSSSNNLVSIYGNRPYVIQVQAGTAPFTLDITGKARFFRPTWNADRYNLIGFGIEGAPTFKSFFGPSGIRHPVNRIFRLNPAGSWESVTDTQTIAANQAYWIFSSGPSTFMGPVAVDFSLSATGELSFGGPTDSVNTGTGGSTLPLDLLALAFTNLTDSPATPSLRLLEESDGPGDLALHLVVSSSSGLSYDRAGLVDSSIDIDSEPLGKTVNPSSSTPVTLGAQRNWSTGEVARTNLYRLNTGAGNAFYLPVSALRTNLSPTTDLLPTAAASYAGLWIGEIKATGVTSIVAEEPAVATAASAAPLRILLHADASGAVRLLNQVTEMQTISADLEVPPVPVLIVNPSKIPFFEGIKERNGRKVGVRFSTVSYDMPRNASTSAQSGTSGDLIEAIVAESNSPSSKWVNGLGLYPDRPTVTDEAIASYLLFRSIRPPSLKEVYQLTLPLTGTLGSGKTVQTNPGTLTLDPFHRSNPFRHAYHQSAARGPQITREIAITFSEKQPIPDILIGTTQEIIQGLTRSDLTVTGSIELRRISSVAVLDTAP